MVAQLGLERGRVIRARQVSGGVFGPARVLAAQLHLVSVRATLPLRAAALQAQGELLVYKMVKLKKIRTLRRLQDVLHAVPVAALDEAQQPPPLVAQHRAAFRFVQQAHVQQRAAHLTGQIRYRRVLVRRAG